VPSQGANFRRRARNRWRQIVPGSASAGARRGHFNTKGTKITKGTKKSYGVFAAETAGDQPGDDLKTSFALFVSFVSKCPRPTPGLRASPKNQ
jgi:hypothetical protein